MKSKWQHRQGTQNWREERGTQNWREERDGKILPSKRQ
jgi:hypothetical protein